MMVMQMIGIKPLIYSCVTVVLLSVGDYVCASKHELTFSSRFRVAELSAGNDSGKSVSGLFRASFESSWSDAFSSFIQLDHVQTGYQNQHSDGVRFNGQPSIPEVEGSEVNQLYGKVNSAGWEFVAGRQVIGFDNQRFVGSVSFWQNEQTFDAVLVKKLLLSASHLTYGYLANANRIFGDDANEHLLDSDINFSTLNGRRPLLALGDHEHDTHLLRAEFNEWDYHKLVLYSYLINNKDAVATSGDTLGAHYRLKIKPRQFQYRVELEAARQQRTKFPAEPTLPYFRMEAGLAYDSLELSARWEALGAKDGAAFVTPLGSLHEFHGWADQLNVPPSIGLVDHSVKLKWRITPFKFDIRVHRFHSDQGDHFLGEEVDVDIIYKPSKKHVVMLRFADFHASDSPLSLEDSGRLMLHYSYNM